MSELSRETLELISSWSEVLGAVFGILAATSVVVYVLVNRPLKKIEALDSQHEKQKTALAQREAADAQRALNAFLMARAFPRQLKNDLRTLLKGLPPAKAEILYKDTDPEAWMFALTIQGALGGAGWSVSKEVAPIAAQRFNGKEFALWGVQIFDKHAALFTPTPTLDLIAFTLKNEGLSENDAKRLALLEVGVDGETVSKDSTLDDNSFRIVVGTRSPMK